MQYELPAPPSTNQLFATIKGANGPLRIKSLEYKAWIKAACLEIMIQRGRIPAAPPPYCIYIRPAYTFGKRDLDNFAKPIIDILVRMNVITRDTDEYVKLVTIETQHESKHCLVSISTYTGGK